MLARVTLFFWFGLDEPGIDGEDEEDEEEGEGEEDENDGVADPPADGLPCLS